MKEKFDAIETDFGIVDLPFPLPADIDETHPTFWKVVLYLVTKYSKLVWEYQN